MTEPPRPSTLARSRLPGRLRTPRRSLDSIDGLPGLSVSRTSMLEAGGARDDRRKQEHAEIALPGRYMLLDRREYPCATIDVSATGVALRGMDPGSIRNASLPTSAKLGASKAELFGTLVSASRSR
jgi:hypothetical protein